MPHSVFGLCGIGDPKSFKLSLEKEGFKIEKFKSFKNHHSFNGSDFKKINKLSNGLPIICTQKDAVKLDLSKISQKFFLLIWKLIFGGRREDYISY